MGFSEKSKSSSEGWGMGLLFVFLPEDDVNNKKKTNHLFSSSSSTSSSPNSFTQPFTAFLKRTNSSHLLTTAQSTISICALLFFITLLLFTLSTFEPTTHHFVPRRQLSFKSPLLKPYNTHDNGIGNSHALQGMGTLHRKGTRAMNELIIAHAVETLTSHELRVFLRLLHRSGLTSRSDLLLISSSPGSFKTVIHEENVVFNKLIEAYSNQTEKGSELTRRTSFDVTQFVKLSKKEKESGETIWGRKIRSNFSAENGTESTLPNYGSVVGFDVDELDPENSLAGFIDHVPMNLRRWGCYPMLLGRLRKNFKLVMLVDVKEILLLGDPLGRVRNRSPETVHLSTTTHTISSRHGKKNLEKILKHVNPGIIMGGVRGVRRLSNAMLTEIARGAMQHKKKNPVTELGLFNQLVANENLLKNVKLITATESIQEVSQLSLSNFTIVRRGNSNTGVESSIIARHICSSPLDVKVYSDC